LIELLTVIVIIGVLAAIILPVVGKVRASARKATGISNLRQVGVAVQTYAVDNKDRLPGPSALGLLHGYGNTDDPKTRAFASYIGPYLGLPDYTTLAAGVRISVPLLICPGFVREKPGSSNNVPHFVQNPNLPVITGPQPRPFGTQNVDPMVPPLTMTDLNNLPGSITLRWIICNADQKVQDVSGTWKTSLPLRGVYDHHRLRLYADSHVKLVPDDSWKN
jgi:type II secretory pathway pseudopilin PulG